MLQYLYRLDYNVQDGAACQPQVDNPESTATEQTSPGFDSGGSTYSVPSIPATFKLTFHSKVYTLAEKVWLDDLKETARKKFEAGVSEDYDLDDFLSAAREAYTGTVDTDRGLRDAITNTLCRCEGIMKNQDIQELVKELHELAYDMVVYMHGQNRF